MRLSDSRSRRSKARILYPNHRLPPWLFSVWSSRSYFHVLARHRRVKCVTSVRLADYRPLPLDVAILHSRSRERIIRGLGRVPFGNIIVIQNAGGKQSQALRLLEGFESEASSDNFNCISRLHLDSENSSAV